MAVLLANILFHEDVISVTETLNNYAEILSPYYLDKIYRMPDNSKKLFHTLALSNENISQSELADLVGANQNDISQAFKWLLINNYVVGDKIKQEKFYRYRIADRIFVLFYYKRYLSNSLEFNRIKILADFLTSFYNNWELSQFALKYLNLDRKKEAREIASLVSDKLKIEESLFDSLNHEELNLLLKSIPYSDNTDDNSRVIGLETMGRISSRREKYHDAIEYHQKALQLRSENGKSWNLGLIGWNYQNINEFEKALEYHEKSIKLCEKTSNLTRKAWNLGQIGRIYMKLQQFDKAIKFHNKSAAMYEDMGDTKELAWNLGQISWIYSNLGKFELAILNHQKSFELFEKENDIYWQAWNLGHLGWIYQNLGKYELAINNYQRSFELFEKENDIYWQAWNLGQIGWVYQNLRKYELAIKNHQKSFELFEIKNDISWQAWNLGQIASVYFQKE